MKRIFRHGLLLIALTIGMAFHLTAQSTQMTIYMNDGTERIYYMSDDDRVVFEGGETLVVEIAVNTKSERYNLSDIRKITCSETVGIEEDLNTKAYLSPNPVHDVFMLHNLNGKETLHIYALDGRLVKTVEADGERPIDISDLSIGLYLVKTQSCTLKMIKL